MICAAWELTPVRACASWGRPLGIKPVVADASFFILSMLKPACARGNFFRVDLVECVA